MKAAGLALFPLLATSLFAGSSQFLYISGKSGNARQALEGLAAALKAAGLDSSSVVSTNVYLADLAYLPQVDRAFRQFFRSGFPARTALPAKLLKAGDVVEISAIAARDPPSHRSKSGAPESAAVEAGGTLFLSGLRPAELGPIEVQTEQVMQAQESILRRAGMSFADLVLTRIYLAEPSAYAGLNEVYRRFVTAPPPARATIHAAPLRPGELLQIQSIAVRGSGAGRPSGEGFTSPIHSFSVKAGNRLYITGMTGRGTDGRFAPEIREQTRQSLKTIEEQLRRYSMTFDDIVDATVWLKDARDFDGMNSVYRNIVKSHGEAFTAVQIPPTAAEALVEIQVIAEKRLQ